MGALLEFERPVRPSSDSALLMSGPSAFSPSRAWLGPLLFFKSIWSCMHRWVNPSVFTSKATRTRSTGRLRDVIEWKPRDDLETSFSFVLVQRSLCF